MSAAVLAILTPTTHATARTENPAPGAVSAAAEATSTADAADPGDRCGISEKLVPGCGAWFGVGPNPHGGESYDQALVNFEDRIERTVDIAHYYTRAQNTLFPTPEMLNRAEERGRERLLLINWRPTITWRAVADGAADDYLEDLAAYIQDVHPEPFFLSLHAEMEPEVDATPGSGMTATDFRDFFRHTVTTLRDHGATSVVTVMNYMGAPHWGLEPWFDSLYPGDAYVDWLAEDQYAFGPPPVWGSDFAGMVDRVVPGWDWPGFYTWATTEHPGKPIMLGEWGVDESPDDPRYKPDFFATTLGQLKEYPQIKALVYWDSPHIEPVGDTRVNTSAASLREFRDLVAARELRWPGQQYLGRPAVPQSMPTSAR